MFFCIKYHFEIKIRKFVYEYCTEYFKQLRSANNRASFYFSIMQVLCKKQMEVPTNLHLLFDLHHFRNLTICSQTPLAEYSPCFSYTNYAIFTIPIINIFYNTNLDYFDNIPFVLKIINFLYSITKLHISFHQSNINCGKFVS